jgi:hypothetical protein
MCNADWQRETEVIEGNQHRYNFVRHKSRVNYPRNVGGARLCGLVVLATDPEARVRFPALPEKKVVGLERGPLSLVSTTEEVLDRKIAAPV